MTSYDKPLPVPDQETKVFWEGARRHELLIQRCESCGTYRFPPRIICPKCGSIEAKWTKSKGKGRVYSHTIVYRHLNPLLQEDVPFNAAIVELDEGVQIVTNIAECRNEDVRIGMPVEVVFHDVSEEITLPRFKPVA